MTKQRTRFNPFYILLVIAGVIFMVTAFAYGVMAVKELHGSRYVLPGGVLASQRTAVDAGFVQFMDTYGGRLLAGELAALGVLTFAAIGTDRFWTGAE